MRPASLLAPVTALLLALPCALAPALCPALCAAQDGGEVAEEAPALAQQRYQAGIECYDARDFECALREMRASYEIFASPNSLLWVGRVLRELGRIAEAVAELEHAAAEARDGVSRDRRYRDTERAATEERDALLSQVGRLRLRVDRGGEDGVEGELRVWIGDREIPAAALGAPIYVDPGESEARVEAAGFAPAQERFRVAAGEEARLSLVLTALEAPDTGPTPVPEPPGDSVGLFFGGLLVGVVGIGGLGASLGLFLHAQSIHDGLVARCGEMACPPELASEIEAGRGADLGSAIALGVGAALTATGAVLLGVALTQASPDRPAGEGEARLRLGPSYAELHLSF